MEREWGFWTRWKLDVLRRYLNAFTTASKNKSSECIYLDLFAGDPENKDRLTGEAIEGSARIALSTGGPQFTRIRLFEIETKATQLEAGLRADFPGRDLKVYGGDCNARISEALAELSDLGWAPTFAFVDPNATEAKWSTLVSLAEFRPARLTKTELFMLFSPQMFGRLLPVHGNEPTPEASKRITEIYSGQTSGNTSTVTGAPEGSVLVVCR